MSIAEDRMSDLPDEILHLIIANLPVASQVQTSVLSRRWKYLWSLNPTVRLLDWPPFPRQTNPIQGYGDHRNLDDLKEEWVDFVASRSIQILNLRDGPSFTRYMKRGLPSLKVLHLSSVNLTDGAPLAQYIQNGLRSLKILELNCITLTDCDLDSLFSSCPLLEFLTTGGCKELYHIQVSSLSLKSLEVGITDLKSLQIGFAPSLVRLAIRCGSDSEAMVSIKNQIPRIQILSIDLHLLQMLVDDCTGETRLPEILGDLKELHLTEEHYITEPTLEALHVFLEKIPSVEKLCIQFRRYPDEYDWSDCDYLSSDDDHEEGEQAYHLRSIVQPTFKQVKTSKSMTRLRTVQLIGFIGSEDEKSWIRFLLGSATNLELLHIYCGSMVTRSLIRLLSGCPKASTNASLMVTGHDDRIDMLCRQPKTIQLYDWGQEAEDVYICSHHLDPIRLKTRVKSIYVYENTNKTIVYEDPGCSVSREDLDWSEIVLCGQHPSVKPTPQKKDEECDAEEEEVWV